MSERSTQIFDSFYEKIKDEYDNNNSSSELNSDRLHNAAIMKLMLESSNEIFMFCGCLSVFRPEFYERIAEVHGADTAEYIRIEMIKALAEFFADNNHRLNVILESGVNDLESSMIVDEETVRAAVSGGNLKSSALNSSFLWGNSLSHFAYSKDSEMLRLESNKIEHTGIYSRKNSELLKEASDTYAMLKSRSRAIA